MKTTDLIKLVLLPVLALLFAACIEIPLHSPLPTPSPDSMQQAAEIARANAIKMGYTPANRLTEIDQCAAPPCFYTLYFTTTDDVARFDARLKANGLVDPDPYELTQDTELFTELSDNSHTSLGKHPTGKYYLPEFETERDHFLSVNGKNPWLESYPRAPLHSTLWQFPREFGNLNFKLYEVSRIGDRYTFADRLITDNIVAIGVEHSRR